MRVAVLAGLLLAGCAPAAAHSPAVGARPVTITAPTTTTSTYAPVDQVELDNLIRRRNAEALAVLRAERVEAAQPTQAGGSPAIGPDETAAAGEVTDDDDSAPILLPRLIDWRPEVERWRVLVARYFQPQDVEHALAIIRCESVGDPEATNSSSGTAGLFQHRPAYWPARSAAAGWAGHSPYDPEANIAVAAWLVYEGGGWAHWSGRAWGVDSCEEWAREQLGG